MTVGTVEMIIDNWSYYSVQVVRNLEGRSQYISSLIHLQLLVGLLLITNIELFR